MAGTCIVCDERSRNGETAHQPWCPRGRPRPPPGAHPLVTPTWRRDGDELTVSAGHGVLVLPRGEPRRSFLCALVTERTPPSSPLAAIHHELGLRAANLARLLGWRFSDVCLGCGADVVEGRHSAERRACRC